MINPFRRARAWARTIGGLDQRLRLIQESLGRVEARLNSQTGSCELRDQEFRVYSQWGEDGILQFLIRHLPIDNRVFVEFGVDNYLESNTRYLLINNNWSGLVMDGSQSSVDFIKADPIYWQHNLKAECAFITKDNINDLLRKNGIFGEIGLLSIDIDGNDYWVWKEIDAVSPAIVVAEYNSRFGTEKAVTVPYDEQFVRQHAHYSMIYFGASLRAFVNLGKKKGYSFVGCNANGVNAFFVRTDLLREPLRELGVEEGYVAGKHREARGRGGELLFLSAAEERAILDELPLVEVTD